MPGPGLSFFDEEERHHVMDVLERRNLSRYAFGDDAGAPTKVVQFERELSARLRVGHVLGTNSCTSALLAGLEALGIGAGDEVIVPGYTFIATIAAIAHARATPVLAEIDDSLTLDPRSVEARITSRTKAVVAVHMLGAPCHMDPIVDLSRRHGLDIIEDVAQACGGSYKGQPLGSIGDFGVFSLNVFKIITAGDGGVLATNRRDLYERAFAIHDHGFRPFRDGVIDDDTLLGLNLRMHELTGAVALAQVRKLDRILTHLSRLKRILKDALSDLAVAFRPLHDATGECGTVVVIQFDDEVKAERVAAQLGTKTLIRSGKHYYGSMRQLASRRMPTPRGCPFDCPVHPSNADYRAGSLPRTDSILARSIALSVGVRDSYLGTDRGLTVDMDEAEARDEAKSLFVELDAALNRWR